MAANLSRSSDDEMVKINDETFKSLVPVLILLSMYIMMGLVGNSLVCYIMGFRLQHNKHYLFILWLAIFDLLTCLLAIPLDIVKLRYYYVFPSEILCKILRFIKTFTIIGSVLILIVIAIDRYKTICTPLHPQMKQSVARWAIFLAIIASILLSWPAPIMAGIRTFELIPGQDARQCYTVSDKWKNTNVLAIYAVLLTTSFIVICLILIILYGRIVFTAKQFRRRQTLRSSDNLVHTVPHSIINAEQFNEEDGVLSPVTERRSSNFFSNSTAMVESNQNRNRAMFKSNLNISSSLNANVRTAGSGLLRMPSSYPLHHFSSMSFASPNPYQHAMKTNISDAPSSMSGGSSKNSNMEFENNRSRESYDSQENIPITQPKSLFPDETSNTETVEDNLTDFNVTVRRKSSAILLETKSTLIATYVTGVFILSYLPHLALQMMRAFEENFEHSLQISVPAFHAIVYNSPYINSISNPIIYGFLNAEFRTEVIILFYKYFSSVNQDIPET